jgi:hypothetical protein
MPKKDSGAIKYPYSRLKGLKDFVAFVQEPGWKPAKIDTALFKKLGMAKGKEGEAVATLRFLELIDETGAPTAEFDELKQNYQVTMKRLVQLKYADLFNLIPPRMANQMRLIKFFGPPVETAEYQAKLFAWLCEEANIELPNVEKRFHRARFDKEEVS